MRSSIARWMHGVAKGVEHAKGAMLRGVLRLGRWFYPLIAILALVALGFDAAKIHWLDEAENEVYDFTLKHRPDLRESNRVAVVEIDACSLDWMQRTAGNGWPWSRGQYADLLMALNDAGAAAVGFDIMLLDPGRDAVGDQVLRQVAGAMTTVSFTFPVTDWDPPRGTGVPVTRIGSARPLTAGARPPFIGIGLPEFPELRGRAGAANLNRDEDGPVRDVELWHQVGGWAVPSLPAIVWSQLEQRPFTTLQQRMRVSWRRHQLDTYKAADLLDDARPCGSVHAVSGSKFLAGRAVFVGYAASGINDAKLLPTGTLIPGVQVQAQVMDNLLTGSGIWVSPAWLKYVLLALAIPGLAFVFWRRAPGHAMDEGLHLIHWAATAIAAITLLWMRIYPDIFAALLALGVYFGLLRGYATAWRRKRMGHSLLTLPHAGPWASLAMITLPAVHDGGGNHSGSHPLRAPLLEAWDGLCKTPDESIKDPAKTQRALIDQWFEAFAFSHLGRSCNQRLIAVWSGHAEAAENQMHADLEVLKTVVSKSGHDHLRIRCISSSAHDATLLHAMGVLLSGGGDRPLASTTKETR